MGFSLCSSSTEISISCLANICPNNNPKSVVRKAFGRVCCSSWRSRMLISCQLVPGQLEGSYVGKKKLHESPSVKLEFLRTLLIDNYDSYTYNIYQELSVINGLPPVVIRNDEWSWEDVCYYLYEVKAFDNIVISPGPGSPARPSDIGICSRLLLECGDIPILGVCLGHQALGYVHGAQVIHAPQPIHGRLSEIEHNNCGLFNGIPTGQGFKVVRYHSLVIDPPTLPQELIPIAWTTSSKTISSFGTYYGGFERQEAGSHKFSNSSSVKLENGLQRNFPESRVMENGNILMGIMHSTRPHYGLQFHPESIATSHGRQIFKNFADITREYWSGLMRSSSDRGRKVPNVTPLLNTSSTTSKHLVNGFDSSSLRNLLKTSSHSRDSRFLKLKWRKVECSASQIGGAENIFCALFGDHHAGNTFWLDSSSTEKDRARFSFMGGKGGSLWRQVTYRLLNKSDRGGNLSIEDADGNITTTYLEDGFFDFLDKELQSFHYDATDYKGLPFDFYGGYVGYIGYDLKIECGARTNRHKSRAPDACFFFADNLLALDHNHDDIYIMSVFDESPNTTPWMDTIEKKLLDMKHYPPPKHIPLSASTKKPPKENRFTPEKSKEQYTTDIEKCLEFIRNGESYELCLTTKMTRNVGKVNSLGFYLNLRKRNPAPYAAWLSFPKEDLCICSSSPERFLKLDRNEVLEAKPIKGTIPRGASPEEDELNKKQLQYSEKDQAENLMIVDLLRNDLGQVCDPGSVHVPNLMEVESYATVHTMVTTIRGRKRSDVTGVDCVRAAFPGGSMTGAPKLRSMEILDCLESGSRGIYSGCIGYFCYNQMFDLNIVIRTIVVKDGEASVGAGGAITALSKSEDEYEEMVVKTRAPVSAVSEQVDADS